MGRIYMQKKFKPDFKAFLPYIIITALIYLLVPALLIVTKAFNLGILIYIVLFPLTAFVLSYVFCQKNRFTPLFAFIFPVIYLPSMIIYGNLKESVLNSVIYLICYGISSYLGMMVGEINAMKSGKKKSQPAIRNDSTEYKRNVLLSDDNIGNTKRVDSIKSFSKDEDITKNDTKGYNNETISERATDIKSDDLKIHSYSEADIDALISQIEKDIENQH